MARHVRMSPQKIRLVVDLIRGQRAEEALQILRYTKKRAARDIEKVLRSAIANAERKAEDAGAIARRGRAVCFALLCERRLALEAPAAGADGTRLSLSEADRAHCSWPWPSITWPQPTARRGGRGRGKSEKGVRGAVKKARKALRTGQQSSRKPSQKLSRTFRVTASQEERFGSEDTSVRVPAGLQQALALALVCRAKTMPTFCTKT
jgi:hypothetical protein